ncbi:tRNA pseudouridine(38-40) synthase TruA [Pueribacillus sp. YX66]|uniref:tRNA pseudouridine(38-40) synthase TruA n=1 Tax=Pueribacillus sp. YX66 TaxID=3229242 RepID=UPI00358D4796
MSRLKAVIAYDGTAFAGYQIQPNMRTVQGELEMALTKIHKGEYVRTYASGRTDAGVHARAQVVHFDSNLSIPEQNWAKAMQALLPDDIVVRSVEKTNDDFHARYDAIKKEYRYRIVTSDVLDVFRRHYTLHIPQPLNITAMRAALVAVKGTYDFTSFCSLKTDIEEKTRTIYEAELVEVQDELVFRFVGNGFLYHMVRILVGTILEVGRGERTPHEMETILAARSREQAGKTAPPQGLVLWSVGYH